MTLLGPQVPSNRRVGGRFFARIGKLDPKWYGNRCKAKKVTLPPAPPVVDITKHSTHDSRIFFSNVPRAVTSNPPSLRCVHVLRSCCENRPSTTLTSTGDANKREGSRDPPGSASARLRGQNVWSASHSLKTWREDVLKNSTSYG